jgi:hypothetical protein
MSVLLPSLQHRTDIGIVRQGKKCLKN